MEARTDPWHGVIGLQKPANFQLQVKCLYLLYELTSHRCYGLVYIAHALSEFTRSVLVLRLS